MTSRMTFNLKFRATLWDAEAQAEGDCSTYRRSVAHVLKLTDESLYPLLPAYQALRPLISLHSEKRLKGGYALAKRSLYALARQHPFARELPRRHMQDRHDPPWLVEQRARSPDAWTY